MSQKKSYLWFDLLFFFLLHLRLCFFRNRCSNHFNCRSWCLGNKSSSSSWIRCWSITEMWKTCWFTACHWPLFACVWHRRCACDPMRMCVSCVFFFWRFQQELPKVKLGRFILCWKNLNQSNTKCEAWSCWALGALEWRHKSVKINFLDT